MPVIPLVRIRDSWSGALYPCRRPLQSQRAGLGRALLQTGGSNSAARRPPGLSKPRQSDRLTLRGALGKDRPAFFHAATTNQIPARRPVESPRRFRSVAPMRSAMLRKRLAAGWLFTRA